ncbi:MAG: methyltransferase domain-containing protein [Hyphomicrobiaceae bacterium]
MASRPRPAAQAEEWSRLGAAAARNGEMLLARGYFARAIDADRRNPSHRYNLGLVLERQGALAEAASLYCEALAVAPGAFDCADRLSAILARYTLEDNRLLDPNGLRAALAIDRIDRQAVGEAALARLKQDGLFDDGDTFTSLPRRTGDTLRNSLLLAALATALNKDITIEHWLVSLRRTLLLETPAERFEDRTLQALALAVARQCLLNEHVWPESEAETAAIVSQKVDPESLVAGDPEMGRRLLLAMLYRPLQAILRSELDASDYAGIRPKAVRTLVVAEQQNRDIERESVRRLERIGVITDPVARRVQSQYESAPYPRWESLRLPKAGAIVRALRRYLKSADLERLDQPFDVLIAGCGTGRQALQSAAGYGAQARVTAIDLSAASLGYAMRQAGHFGVTNITFAQADLMALEPTRQQFDVVECVGVLHHMADPWAGLDHVTSLVKPGGLAYLGLYSGIARRQIAALRQDPDYPGPGCSDHAARIYRQKLIDRTDGDTFAQSRDFYSLSEFRDLALHESEQPLLLADIAQHLESSGLEFLGFTSDPDGEAKFASAYPDEPFPGRLLQWIALEADNPHLFDAMYRFWVRKTV